MALEASDRLTSFESIGGLPMDVFQCLPSNSVPLCLTSWENQKKSAKTSEKNIVDLDKSDSSLGCEDAEGIRYKSISIHNKKVLYQHRTYQRSARKKPLLQNCHKKSTVCNWTWGQKSYFLEKCPLV
jgi:hypothetical protein